MSCFVYSHAELNLSDFPDEPQAFLSVIGQEVQIRGFWVPLSSSHGVLTSSPNMKSCCLMAPTKIYQQVLVKGNVESSENKVVTLEGIFIIEPLYNQENKPIQYYVLEQAKEVQKGRSYLLFLMVPFIAAVFLLRKKLMAR